MFPYCSSKAERKKLQAPKKSIAEKIVDKLSAKPYASGDGFAGALSISLGAHCKQSSHTMSGTDEEVRVLLSPRRVLIFSSRFSIFPTIDISRSMPRPSTPLVGR